MEQKSKNESLMNFLTTLLRRSADLPEDIKTMVESTKKLSEELIKLSKTVATLVVTVYDHSAAINDLYNVQLFILQQLKSQGIETKVPDPRKDKFNKPN